MSTNTYAFSEMPLNGPHLTAQYGKLQIFRDIPAPSCPTRSTWNTSNQNSTIQFGRFRIESISKYHRLESNYSRATPMTRFYFFIQCALRPGNTTLTRNSNGSVSPPPCFRKNLVAGYSFGPSPRQRQSPRPHCRSAIRSGGCLT